jgi:imidazolonepropionase-like amidohydrolase
MDTIRALHQAGVTILAGTDTAWIGVPGTAHGVSLHGELELLVKSGLRPAEALSAATALPAQVFGLTDRGQLRAGLQADMMLIDGDPLTDITDTLAIDTVWRRGQPLTRTTKTPTNTAP